MALASFDPLAWNRVDEIWEDVVSMASVRYIAMAFADGESLLLPAYDDASDDPAIMMRPCPWMQASADLAALPTTLSASTVPAEYKSGESAPLVPIVEFVIEIAPPVSLVATAALWLPCVWTVSALAMMVAPLSA